MRSGREVGKNEHSDEGDKIVRAPSMKNNLSK